MRNKAKDVCCLLFEGGAIKLAPLKEYQPIGDAQTTYYRDRPACTIQAQCPFFVKYQRCPTWEEISSKYLSK